jgi:hypothetical protein
VASILAMAVGITAIVVGAAALGLAPLLGTTPPVAASRSVSFVFPVYNNRGLEAVRNYLRPYLRRGDTFMIVSGNQDGPYDPAWVNAVAEDIRTYYPGTRILAATSGMANVDLAIAGTEPPVEGLVYIYEPDFANEPEFVWEDAPTRALFDAFAAGVREAGFRAVGKPTGRALLEPARGQYLWNYQALGSRVDDLFVQTQSFCDRSVEAFEAAIDTLQSQHPDDPGSDRWLPQITVDVSSESGVPATRALGCAEAAMAKQVDRFLLWWSPAFVDEAVQFLAGVRS